ncbi:sporulation protein YqfC [Abyssisolibacter fermentans]|uniref:sporulation protein YqfC n=1 Tax=Abyssisolibacter fermentans TaxID=1766203 RepID=UPI0008341C4B|nr:sporulation protein YqfC [Abyssisolibacter fermentans]
MNQIKNDISDVLELPKDIVMDLPKITVIGNIQAYIENHKGILEYSKTIIRVKYKGGIVKILGNDMFIRTIVSEEIIITGIINEIEYLN